MPSEPCERVRMRPRVSWPAFTRCSINVTRCSGNLLVWVVTTRDLSRSTTRERRPLDVLERPLRYKLCSYKFFRRNCDNGRPMGMR